MKVLVACEESQRVCSAFRARGHLAFSCDIIKPSGGHPEWHIQQDVLPLLNGNCDFETLSGDSYHIDRWDLIIAHPPCTYLTTTGNRWFNIEKYGDKARERYKLREEAIKFFMAFVEADCDHIMIENPVGIMSTQYRKPDQIIQPYWFGDPFEKRTCLWLKGLPPLKKTDEVTPEKRKEFKSGKSMPAWYAESFSLPAAERTRVRSQTFPGFAEAMAEQWGHFVSSEEKQKIVCQPHGIEV